MGEGGGGGGLLGTAYMCPVTSMMHSSMQPQHKYESRCESVSSGPSWGAQRDFLGIALSSP